MVEKVEAIMPGSSLIAHVNRAFLQRAVGFCVEAGIRQFLDLGAGIPTVGSVHEVAQSTIPDARVVYVDADPIAVAHSRAILAGNPYATAIHGDVRQPAEILNNPQVTEMIDFSQPVAALLIAVLHFVPDDDDPTGIVEYLHDRLAPGSYLVLSHGCREAEPDAADQVKQVYRSTATPLTLRERGEIAQFFAGFELVEPGLTWVTGWRSDDSAEPERREMLAGVGRKPGHP
jgi:SAM-dependent methyltransferase